MSKEKHRFLFFKYVPEKRTSKPEKEVVAEPVEMTVPAEGLSEEVKTEFWPGTGYPDMPQYPEEDCYDKPPCSEDDYICDPEYPDDSCHDDDICPDEEYPSEPECPEEEYPDEECPEDEYPKEPECPEEEYPKEPECPEPDPCPKNSVMHIVKRGDTYWKLAQKYNTTVEAIEAANPGVNPLNLQIGQELCIPLGVPGAKG